MSIKIIFSSGIYNKIQSDTQTHTQKNAPWRRNEKSTVLCEQ